MEDEFAKKSEVDNFANGCSARARLPTGLNRRLTIPRRLEACKQLGWKTITAIVLDYSAANDDATAELSGVKPPLWEAF